MPCSNVEPPLPESRLINSCGNNNVIMYCEVYVAKLIVSRSYLHCTQTRGLLMTGTGAGAKEAGNETPKMLRRMYIGEWANFF